MSRKTTPSVIVEACKSMIKAQLTLWDAERALEKTFGGEDMDNLSEVLEHYCVGINHPEDVDDEYGEMLEEKLREHYDLKHVGIECALCDQLIESEDDGESTPEGSMHKACAVQHEHDHPEMW